MRHVVDHTTVSTTGLESSPHAEALAGLRANEARYWRNKYDHEFAVVPADEAPDELAYVERVLRDERDIVVDSPALEVSRFEAGGLLMTYVFYASGLVVNVMWALDDGGKRAVGFKLSEGMEIPSELSAFRFARQRSKLAGEIRGSYFVIKGRY